MRTVTVSHNWYSFPWCSGTAIPTVFGVPPNVSCQDVLGVVGISWDEVGAGTFPDSYHLTHWHGEECCQDGGHAGSLWETGFGGA